MTTKSPWRRRLVVGLCLFLAVEFILGGAAKFLPGETFFGPPYSEKFVDWGYPAWFRFIVGAGEVAGGVLLALPRRRFLGAGLLAVILAGAVITHIVDRSAFHESVSAPVHLVLVSIAALATRPASWRELRAIADPRLRTLLRG